MPLPTFGSKHLGVLLESTAIALASLPHVQTQGGHLYFGPAALGLWTIWSQIRLRLHRLTLGSQTWTGTETWTLPENVALDENVRLVLQIVDALFHVE